MSRPLVRGEGGALKLIGGTFRYSDSESIDVRQYYRTCLERQDMHDSLVVRFEAFSEEEKRDVMSSRLASGSVEPNGNVIIKIQIHIPSI